MDKRRKSVSNSYSWLEVKDNGLPTVYCGAFGSSIEQLR